MARMLRSTHNGHVYMWTPLLAKVEGMEEFDDGKPNPVQPGIAVQKAALESTPKIKEVKKAVMK